MRKVKQLITPAKIAMAQATVARGNNIVAAVPASTVTVPASTTTVTVPVPPKVAELSLTKGDTGWYKIHVGDRFIAWLPAAYKEEREIMFKALQEARNKK